ncbi:MAG: DUF3888 domain-containing protein [Oscillospiraceae bacterium]|nr:DUF3888 domain-containing protein [Oscillospiraceae bacterium]
MPNVVETTATKNRILALIIFSAMQTIKTVIILKNKKILLTALLSLIVISQLLLCSTKAMVQIALDDPVRLNDMVITLLMPSIQEAVESFYEPYLTIEPTVATYYASKIIEIQGGERIHEGIYNSRYIVTVDVFPYIGPHISVGKDRITLNVQPDGVSVESYEHLESHKFPPHLQSLIKKAFAMNSINLIVFSLQSSLWAAFFHLYKTPKGENHHAQAQSSR